MASPTLITALFDFPNPDNDGVYCVGLLSGTPYPFYLDGDGWYRINQGLSLPYTGLYSHDVTVAENCAIIAGDVSTNRQIDSDGRTMYDSSDLNSHVYGSPPANKVNYFKGRLYLADLLVGSQRYPTRVQVSSPPLGIVGLIEGDHDSGVTEVRMTDVKYVRVGDTLDIWRGTSSVGTITVTAKSQSSVTCTATSFAMLNSDEAWVSGTYNGKRLFRWADRTETGTGVKKYDTFDLPGGTGDRITMMANVGGVEVIASKTAMAYWDDSQLISMDANIGCVSDKGSVLHMGHLFFVNYTGVYSTTGAVVPTYRSAKVEPYFRGATKANMDKCAMGRKGTSVFVAIGDVTLYNDDGSVRASPKDVCLEYDIQKDDWAVHTNVPANVFANFTYGSRTDRLLYGTDRGFWLPQTASYAGVYGVREFLDPNRAYDFDGVNSLEIIYRMDLPRMQVSALEEGLAEVRKAVLQCDRGSEVQLFVREDGDSDFHACAGEFTKGAKVVTVTSNSTKRGSDLPGPMVCRALDVSVRGSTRSKTRFSGMVIEVEDSVEQAEGPGQDVNGA